MPEYLPTILGVSALILNVLGWAVTLGMMRQSINENSRRTEKLEGAKLDANVFDEHRGRVFDRLDAADKGVASAGHRMNGIDMRITSEADRLSAVVTRNHV